MNPRAVAVFAALFLLAAVLVVACSKSTSPTYGGGGGGGGTTLNLTFPATGASKSFVFPTAGSVPYHCSVHSGMTGTVMVSAGGADSDTVAVGVNGSGVMALTFTPTTVTIKPGGTVRWINRSSMTNHTVTAP